MGSGLLFLSVVEENKVSFFQFSFLDFPAILFPLVIGISFQILQINLFVDDGDGFIDLGLDNTFEFDDDGNLIAGFDNTWMSINGQIVAYYHTDTEDNGDSYSINGYVPAYLNGQRVELLLAFTDKDPDGTITGARYIYDDEQDTVDTIAKNTIALSAGDRTFAA